MTRLAFLIVLGCVLDGPGIEGGHSKNQVYQGLVTEGASLGGTLVKLPLPRLGDDQSATDQRKAVQQFAGGERAATEMLADSITAPFVLKVHDEKTPGGDIIRMADLVFAVHADFGRLDPSEAAKKAADKVMEVANMRVETKIVPSTEPDGADGSLRSWRTHLSARLLDRIEVEATDEVVVTRTDRSIVVASRLDRTFDRDPKFPNLWRSLDRDGKPISDPHPYPGGVGYTKISKLAEAPGTLFVEAHFAFLEPKKWFDGSPILRSKFAPIAQDQVRRLRRESKAQAR